MCIATQLYVPLHFLRGSSRLPCSILVPTSACRGAAPRSRALNDFMSNRVRVSIPAQSPRPAFIVPAFFSFLLPPGNAPSAHRHCAQSQTCKTREVGLRPQPGPHSLHGPEKGTLSSREASGSYGESLSAKAKVLRARAMHAPEEIQLQMEPLG